jgi:hypothetical protein
VVGLGQKGGKFSTAQATEDIMLAQSSDTDSSELAERLIAGSTTIGVINQLEVIDIQHQDSQQVAIAAAAVFFEFGYVVDFDCGTCHMPGAWQ